MLRYLLCETTTRFDNPPLSTEGLSRFATCRHGKIATTSSSSRWTKTKGKEGGRGKERREECSSRQSLLQRYTIYRRNEAVALVRVPFRWQCYRLAGARARLVPIVRSTLATSLTVNCRSRFFSLAVSFYFSETAV